MGLLLLTLWEIWFMISLDKNIFKDILKKKPNLYNLVQIDLLNKNIRKILESVDIGFVAKHSLEQIKSSLNSAKIMEFKKQAGEFLVKLPLKYVVERSAVFLNPILMGILLRIALVNLTWTYFSRSLYLLVEFLLDLPN